MQNSKTCGQSSAGPGCPLLRAGVVPVAVVLGVLLVSGVAQRVIEARINTSLSRSTPPLRPLSSLPLRLGSWSGQDEPLDERVRRIAAEDDFINRIYVSDSSGKAVRVYVGYLGRPRSRLIHRITGCRAAHGWKMVTEERWTMASPQAGAIPSLVYEWNLLDRRGPREMDLAIYVINGQYCNDPGELDQYNRRDVFGRSARYVARIQLTVEATGDRKVDLQALSDLASEILGPVHSLLPDHRQATTAAGP